MNKVKIRSAVIADAPRLMKLIGELAVYEKLAKSVVGTPSRLKVALKEKHAFALIAEMDGETIGFAIYFFNFSTFLTKRGLYLEDLFVKPEFRGRGAGAALFKKLRQIARKEKCGRMEWAVLDWNKPAIEFYCAQGAKPMGEWTTFRLDEKALHRS